MKKTPTLFDRDWQGDKSRVVPVVNPVAQWVIDREGVATRKIDGMCTAVIKGIFYKRREVKTGKEFPTGFIVADIDDTTGKTVGWQPVGEGPEDRYLREAFPMEGLPDGTYEFVGPKSQGGVEGYSTHKLIPHTLTLAFSEDPPRDFEGLRKWMLTKDIEGVVWHHPDGRMAKLKLKDFGLKREQQRREEYQE